MTMKKNIAIIEKSFKGKGYNYLSSSLNSLMNIGLCDHGVIDEIVKELKDNKLHLLIEESSQLEIFILGKIQFFFLEKSKYFNIHA